MAYTLSRNELYGNPAWSLPFSGIDVTAVILDDTIYLTTGIRTYSMSVFGIDFR
jgi:hypothetical protein